MYQEQPVSPLAHHRNNSVMGSDPITAMQLFSNMSVMGSDPSPSEKCPLEANPLLAPIIIRTVMRTPGTVTLIVTAHAVLT